MKKNLQLLLALGLIAATGSVFAASGSHEGSSTSHGEEGKPGVAAPATAAPATTATGEAAAPATGAPATEAAATGGKKEESTATGAATEAAAKADAEAAAKAKRDEAAAKGFKAKACDFITTPRNAAIISGVGAVGLAALVPVVLAKIGVTAKQLVAPLSTYKTDKALLAKVKRARAVVAALAVASVGCVAGAVWNGVSYYKALPAKAAKGA